MQALSKSRAAAVQAALAKAGIDKKRMSNDGFGQEKPLDTNVAADRASVGRFGYCAVDGIGEKIPLDVLPRATATEILTGLGENNWSRQSFTSDAGLPQRLPAAGADREATLDRIVPVKCRRPLPPGREMAVVWDARIAQAGVPGRTAGRDRRLSCPACRC